ncbi:MAG: hypothetical protein A3H94_02530 [Acidobacteria bacterium RIFCSPLOWO2_02_FULL_60_20]|nr:MAG: hypothetical protein A3H94_02530 [Acidobacteria bacterium RIFCSPLOWO2_02_FULL_60_20]
MNRTFVFSFLLFPVLVVTAWGQSAADVAARLGYPQLVIHNAKIATMDDDGVNENLGRTVQALAVRDGKILAVGSNAEVRALAGPQTKQLDMQGRLVLPGLVITHEHPNDWMFQEPTAWENSLPLENDLYQVHWLPAGPADDQYKYFWSSLREMTAKAKPGQWIMLNFDRATNLQQGEDTMKFLGGARPQISKESLDEVAPNNPVLIHSGSAMSVINSKALQEIEHVFPGFKEFSVNGTLPLGWESEDVVADFQQRPVGILNRNTIPNIIMKGDYRMEAKLLKASLELWAAYGMTSFASAPYDPVTFQAFSHLDRSGEMPVRFAWGYIGPDFSERTLRTIAGLLGRGTDYMWNIGSWPQTGSSCTTIDAPPQIKQQEQCHFAPGMPAREIVNRIIRTGGRIATMHTDGDKDIGYLLDAIEEESAKAGFTLDDIRAKRQTFDHLDGAPRPDQIPRIKNLGMTLSGQNYYLVNYGGAYKYARDYGEQYTCWIVPRKSLFDAGIKVGWEVDKPVPWLVFQRVLDGMKRLNPRDGKVHCPSEQTSRIVQIKAMTTWGAYYMLREDRIGSLEPGKLADFIVLDRDFFTVPEQEIPNLHVLMTVVGGKTVHLVPSLAKPLGLQPVGPVTWNSMSLPYLAEAKQQ